MENKKNLMNERADFWRYKIGANVTPANTREKIVTVSWKSWQTKPISEEQHNRWKEQRAFDLGMAVMAGQLWHTTDAQKKGKYLILVDIDNQKGIDELCTVFNCSLKEIAKRIIVEQHMDQLNKAHLIFYATHPFPKKGHTVTRPSDTSEHEYIEPPAIEVTRMLFCSSVHKNGEKYEIIGTKEPETMDEMEKHLQDILKKYGIRYPNGNDDDDINQTSVGIDNNLTPMKDLFRPGIKIFEGQNRHEALMRAMEHIMLHNSIIDEVSLQKFAEDWNNQHCEPPLDKTEFAKQWKAAVSFVDQIKKQRAKEQFEIFQRLKREQVEEELANSEERENEKKNPLSVGVLARLNEEGLGHYGCGQLSSLGALYKRVRAAFFKCQKCGRQKEVVFDHPQTRQYFIETMGFGGWCYYRFPEGDNECDGHVKAEPKWVNALDIEVSDTNSLQDIDRLKCILLGDDTKDVGIGEDVTVFGALYMEGTKNGPTFPVGYIQSIKYQGREQEELTKLDIESIRRFRERFKDDKQYIEKLVSMTACNVIGLEEVKEGILYMVARAKPDKPDKRERIHAIIISLPGMAKTALLNYTTELMERSTFETAQLSTGLSLIVIVENTRDMKVLRLGPVSSSMLACVDEFNRLSGYDQEKFFGVMEEGKTTTVKFGRKVKINAPVTILASINPPEGSDYDSQGMIDLQSMNIIAPILSRFDLKFYIAPLKGEDEIRKQIDKKAYLENRMHGAPNYSKFLKKMMVYIKQRYSNPTLTAEALSVISEAYLQLRKDNNSISLRVYNLLVNLTKARSMLLQKIIADSDIAKATIKYYTKTIEAYQIGTISVEPKDPIEVAIEECKKFLCETFGQQYLEHTESDLLKQVCDSNRQVERYVKSGVPKMNYFDKSNNKKARFILERLRVRFPEIAIVSKKPVTLKWVPLKTSASNSDSDHSDHDDPSVEEGVSSEKVTSIRMTSAISKSQAEEGNNTSTNSKWLSPQNGSDESDRSECASSFSSDEILYSCYICIHNHRPRFDSHSKDEYENHCSLRHPGKPCYPGKADLKFYGWKPQGKPWENL
jgi:DNA replicative helicase MCM subunit Mcm2 (Cdc46/Mcm family)